MPRGRKPRADASAEPVAEVTPDAPEEKSFELSITLTTKQIDQIWMTLTPLQQATGLMSALQCEAEEESEN